MSDGYPIGLTDDEKHIFDMGWSAASANLALIWEGYKENNPGNHEGVVTEFDNFMSMVLLRLQGATNEDLAMVAELRGDEEMANYLRE